MEVDSEEVEYHQKHLQISLNGLMESTVQTAEVGFGRKGVEFTSLL